MGPGRGCMGPLSNSNLRIAAPIPMGSITVPNKNGDFISTVSSEENVTSTPRRWSFPACFQPAALQDRAGDTRPVEGPRGPLAPDPGSCSSRQGGLKLKGSGHSPAQVPMGQALCQALGRKGEGSSGHLPAEKGGAAGARASSLPGGQEPGGGLSL